MLDLDDMNSRMGKILLAKLEEKLKCSGKAPIAFCEYQKEMQGAIFLDRQG